MGRRRKRKSRSKSCVMSDIELLGIQELREKVERDHKLPKGINEDDLRGKVENSEKLSPKEARAAKTLRCKDRWDSWSEDQKISWLKRQYDKVSESEEEREETALRDKERKEKEAAIVAAAKKKIEASIKNREQISIEIAVNCYRYQHRLCWMLSSLLQQEGDLPELTTCISYCEDEGNPPTKDVCDFFRDKGLIIKEQLLSEEEIKNRSLARNKQITETEADWILFADCDMVYSPEFFDDLKKQLMSDGYKYETKVIGGDRVSLDIDFCSEYFDSDTTEYPCVIPEVAKKVSSWPVYYTGGRKRAAGFFQLANVISVREHGGLFSNRKNDNLRTYYGDRAFRVQLGGKRGMKVKPQYHLNHTRDWSGKQR